MMKLPTHTIHILTTYKTDVTNATSAVELMRIVNLILVVNNEVR
jgi:hypothetical protein